MKINIDKTKVMKIGGIGNRGNVSTVRRHKTTTGELISIFWSRSRENNQSRNIY